MATKVNLDALIVREDFEVEDKEEESSASRLGTQIKLSELASDSITYHTLRKPDFQRETASWAPRRVADFVKSFIDDDLIPAVIMWRSPKSGNNFVIDGAHRLSALIGWIHDDYGDEQISRPHFANLIDPAQTRVASRTRKLINGEIGPYARLVQYPANPASAPDDLTLRRARNIANLIIELQWVKGDANNAEKSFLRINSSAEPINDTELELIQARKKANAIAARALVRAGTGHKYWSKFSPNSQSEIEGLSRQVYDSLFKPIVEYPLKTLDIPVAGSGYGPESLKMILDLVNYINKTEPSDNPDDADGQATIRHLKAVRRAAARVFGEEPGSLGLHPGVYCYSISATFQPAAFIAAVAFVKELVEARKLKAFTEQRANFEEALVSYKYFVNQILSSKGSGLKSLGTILAFYHTLLDGVKAGLFRDQLLAHIKANPRLSFLHEQTEEDRKYGRNFTKETKNTVYYSKAMAGALRCEICYSRLHFKSISLDHSHRKEDGGRGSPDNADLTHPYCNTGFKESGGIVVRPSWLKA